MGKQEFTTLCYVEHEGKVLMLNRNKKKQDINKDKYIGIGGHLEHGESPEECILREAFEETGLTLHNPKLRGMITFVIDDYDEYSFLYTCDDFEGELRECDEGELVWVEKERVRELPLWEGDREFLPMLWEESGFFTIKLVYVNDRLTEVVRRREGIRTE